MNLEGPEQLGTPSEEQPVEEAEKADTARDIERSQETIQDEPEVPEGKSLELDPGKKRIMEESSEKRSGVLNEYMSSEIVSTGLNMVPYVGGPKMVHEAITGRHMTGKGLKGVERVIHAGVGAASISADFLGGGELASQLKLEGESALVVGKVGKVLMEKEEESKGRVFERTSKFMADHPEETAEAERYGDKRINDSRTLLESGI